MLFAVQKEHQQPRVPGIIRVRPDTGYTSEDALLPELVNKMMIKDFHRFVKLGTPVNSNFKFRGFCGKMIQEWLKEDKKMDRFFRCLTKGWLLLLLFGGALTVFSGEAFVISMKPAVSFQDMTDGTEIKEGSHVAGNVAYSLDYFASETTYTRYQDGSRSGNRKNGNYYLIPTAQGFAGLKCREADVPDMNKLTEETFALLEGGPEPSTEVFFQGRAEKMEGNLVKYYQEYLTDMGYSEKEIAVMGEPLVIRYTSFGAVRVMFAIGVALLVVAGIIFGIRFKREGQSAD